MGSEEIYKWPLPDLKKPHISFKVRNSLIIPWVGTFSKIWLTGFNTLKIQNVDTLRNWVSFRPKNVPLLTVSNHHSCADDPTLWGMLRWRDLWSAQTMRWSLGAHDIIFTNAIHSWFFSSGKCVPVVRGLGVYQKGMDFCIERLQEGHWVHIFPEGKVNMSLERLRLKWGVGRLIYESSVCPIVLPFYHMGMDSILPNKEPYVPQMGKTITVVVGEPMDFNDVVRVMKDNNEDPMIARKVITDRIQEELGRLRDLTEELHRKNLNENKSL